MYSSSRESWNGFFKNALVARSASARRADGKTKRYRRWQTNWPLLWQAPLFAWSYAALFVIPWFNLTFTGQRPFAIFELCGLLLVRGLANWYLKRPFTEILLTPLAGWRLLALGMATLYRR